MIENGKLVCDNCRTEITRIEKLPPEGWPTMHNLCSSCFRELGKKAVARG